MTLLERRVSTTAGLMSDAERLDLTAEAFAEEVIRLISNADRADFARGPYVYSVTVLTRGEGGTSADPSAVYHDRLHGRDSREVREALAPLAKPDFRAVVP